MLNQFFKPLSADYCLYFYIITLFSFIMLLFSVVGSVVGLIKSKKDVNFKVIAGLVYVNIGVFMFYLQNRLLYGMCVNSL